MSDRNCWCWSFLLCCLAAVIVFARANDSQDLFLLTVENSLLQCNQLVNAAAWNYSTNITEETREKMVNAEATCSTTIKELAHTAEMYLENENQLNFTVKRAFELLSLQASGEPLSETLQRQLSSTLAEMEGIYSSARDSQGRTLEDLEQLLATSKNLSILKDAWSGWRAAVGPKVRPLYHDYIEALNAAASDHGFNGASELWKAYYDMPVNAVEEMIERLWMEVFPLYQQLHCYIRKKLNSFYESQGSIEFRGRLRADIFGNMWAQEWDALYDITAPYEDAAASDISLGLVEQNYTPISMVQFAESFFTSLGFPSLPNSFYERSMFVKPSDREVVCHASAWDLTKGDVRLKMCISVNQEDFVTIHHELGHIYYFLAYENLSQIFADGANDGFHEAIGDTVALSVMTPSYLSMLNLANITAFNRKSKINWLYKMALSKVAFLPFGLLVDKFRWDMFSGKVDMSRANSHWWALRRKYQGIEPPLARNDEIDFDAAAKYHICSGTPYLRYFLAALLQFQFHESLCKTVNAGQAEPQTNLSLCSIYGSKEAGEALHRILALGKSVPWQQVMEEISGKPDISSLSILAYFQPLYEWLQEENKDMDCSWEGMDAEDLKTLYLSVSKENMSSSIGMGTWIAAVLVMLAVLVFGIRDIFRQSKARDYETINNHASISTE